MSSLPTGVVHLRCDNPGPMTLTGTNSYVLGWDGGARGSKTCGGGVRGGEARDGAALLVAVIDPGPQDDAHREALLDTVASTARDLAGGAGGGADDVARGVDVAVLLTHHHDDHEGGAGALIEALRGGGSDRSDLQVSEVTLYGGAQGREFVDGELFGDLQVVRAPGHTRDSVAFLLERDGRRVLFSGDTVLGAGSSFVAHPDGDLTAYLATLDVLAALTAAGTTGGAENVGESREVSAASNAERVDGPAAPVVLAPGHGPVGGDAGAVIAQYRAHRAARLDEVRAALADVDGAAAGDELVDAVVQAVYADVDPSLRPAVDAIVRAQLAHLGRR